MRVKSSDIFLHYEPRSTFANGGCLQVPWYLNLRILLYPPIDFLSSNMAISSSIHSQMWKDNKRKNGHLHHGSWITQSLTSCFLSIPLTHIPLQVTYNKLHILKVYILINFDICIHPWNHCHCQDSEIVPCPPSCPVVILPSSLPTPSQPYPLASTPLQSPSNHRSAFCHYSLVFTFWNLHTWNYMTNTFL